MIRSAVVVAATGAVPSWLARAASVEGKKRKTLVVRLHRMVHAGRLSSHSHGHYTLSEAERSRRRA